MLAVCYESFRWQKEALTPKLFLILVAASSVGTLLYTHRYHPEYHAYVHDKVFGLLNNTATWWQDAEGSTRNDISGWIGEERLLLEWSANQTTSNAAIYPTQCAAIHANGSGHGSSTSQLTNSSTSSLDLRLNQLTALIEKRISSARLYLRALRKRDKITSLLTGRFLTHNFTDGRLGNWMFQAASLIGVARTNQRIPIILKSQKLRSQLFEAFHLSLIDPEALFSSPADMGRLTIPDSGAGRYNPATENLTVHCQCLNQTLILHGYLQSWKYFHKNRDEIRQIFTFRKWVLDSAKNLIADGLRRVSDRVENIKLIGVHVRRGDHTVAEFNQIGHVPASEEYLLHTTRYFEDKYCNTVFFVVTDDFMYCQNLFRDRGDRFVIVEGNYWTPEVDMAILTLMDHLVLTVGTFGWWGAYLSDAGETVHYKDWPRNGSTFHRQLDKGDFFPPSWKAW